MMLLMHVPTAGALGFGRVSSATTLGQQLDFSVVLTTDAGELLPPECVTAEVYAGESLIPPSLVRTRVDTPADGGPSTLRIVTNVRIDEPVASVNVTAGCPVRLVRKFVVFVDPPVIVAPPSVATNDEGSPAAAAPVSSRRVASAPLPPARRPAPVKRPPRTPPTNLAQDEARTARLAPPRNAAAAAIEPQRMTSTKRATVVAGAAVNNSPTVPRLKLEAALPAYRPGPAASGAAAAEREASLASSPSTGELIADAEQLRMQLLEQNIQKLLTEARATQNSLAAMQSRLREAEAARYSNPLIYALMGLVGLLLAAVLLLLWRQSRMKREAAWWVAGNEAEAAAAAAGGAPVPADVAELDDQPARYGEKSQALPVLPLDQLRGQAGVAPQSFVVDGGAAGDSRDAGRDFLASAPGELARDMSVEELIDMEQQAEFFIVLGQDDAAIDLLMGHVRNGGSTSPLAFLKLLEIYRRRDERDPYDRVRERFNRRFNAYAPDWEAGAAPGKALEEYPHVVAQLQAAWPNPAEAMKLLEALLFRRDASASTFDLPAYGELLFLYSQARDLADSKDPEPGDVDLLLPLGEDFDFVEPPRATQSMALDGKPTPRNVAPVDFDIDFNAPPSPKRR